MVRTDTSLQSGDTEITDGNARSLAQSGFTLTNPDDARQEPNE